MYKLILADGREIPNLSKNGTNFTSATKIDENIFKNNLSTLTIVGEGEEQVMYNAYLVQQVKYDWDENWYLCFAEQTGAEKQNAFMAQLRADVDFISIMQGVEL